MKRSTIKRPRSGARQKSGRDDSVALRSKSLSLQEAVAPILGKFAWQARRGVGFHLTFEFGQPHLQIMELTPRRKGTSKNLLRNVYRRRIYVHGEFHLWIMYCKWKLVSAYAQARSETSTDSKTDKLLRDLDSQRLVAFTATKTKSVGFRLQFDLGGELILEPHPEFPGDDLWALHFANGWIYVCRADGSIVGELYRKRRRTAGF